MTDAATQKHYTECAIEPIDYMRAVLSHEQFEGYLRGNIIKYISRYPKKGGIDDLEKAAVYLQWLQNHIRESCNGCEARLNCDTYCYKARGIEG